MFDFIKELDSLLYKDFDDINKNIQLKTNTVETTLQIYAERLLKIVNNKERIITKNKVKFGELISNDYFCKILKDKYKISDDLLLNLNVINNKSNDHKHEERSTFIQKELKKMYRLLLYTTANVYSVIFNNNIELTGVDSFFEKLLQYDSELEEKLRNQIKKDFEEKNKDKEQQVKETNLKIKIKEQELSDMQIKLAEYNDTKERIIELETKNSEANNLIDSLREELAILESKVNEASDINLMEEKKELLKQLEEKESIIVNNNILIEEYRNKTVENPTILIDSYEKIIYELKEKLSILENSNFIEEQVKNSELFELKRKLDRKVCFDSSYVLDDVSYIFKNISYNNTSTSQYKQFYAVVNNLLQRGQVVRCSDYIQDFNLDDKEKKELIRLQMMILSLIRNDKLKDSVWKINYINGNLKLLEIAIEDIFNYVEKLTSIANIKFNRPKINITNNDYDDSGLYVNIDYSNNFELDVKYAFYIEDIETIETSEDDIGFSKIDDVNLWIEESIVYDIKEKDRSTVEWFLKNIFGYDSFREGQFEIIAHTLSGKNTIGILPTGSGKSIVYQLSSLLQPKITIVIAPTRELINDQIRVLNNRFNITRTTKITSDANVDKNKALEDLGNLKNIFTFIAPERLQSSEFRSKLLILQSSNAFDRIVLDEVHCLSEWGHDFRIPYLMVAHTLKQYCSEVKFLGLTATASKSVVRDLMVELNIKKREDIIFNESYKRDNLIFEFNYFDNENEMDNALVEDLYDTDVTLKGDKTNSVLIFSKRKKIIDELTDYLSSRDLFGDKVSKYYSTDSNSFTNEVLSTEEFINNEKSILVCTKAFGMGIDKPNIRATFHYGIPLSLEAFYQEAGRAGREIGSKAICRIISHKYNSDQNRLINEFLDINTPIYRLKEITEDPRIQYIVDVASNFYFLTERLNEPEEEAKQTIEFYKNLYGLINNCLYKFVVDKNYYIINSKGKKEYKDNKSRYEKFIYILHKCGIVDNWEVSYLKNQLEFRVLFDSKYKDIEYIKIKTKSYIMQYPAENKDTLETIDNVKSYHELVDIFYAIRKWYYGNFIMTKRNQLANIYQYATKSFCNRDCSDEIQSLIDNYFNIADVLRNTGDGFYYGFEKDSIERVISHVIKVKDINLTDAISSIESELESVENNKMRLYISMLHLRNNNFDTRNGKNLFEYVLKNTRLEEKVDIYKYIALSFYKILTESQKEILLDILYGNDKELFRNVLLENIDDDNIIRKYWLPFINKKLEEIL